MTGWARFGIVTAVSSNPDHRLGKSPQHRIRLLTALGVEGDAHLGTLVRHRSRVARDPTQVNLRQVHLIHSELHEDLFAKGFDIGPGMMGENVTTRGLDLLGLPHATLLKLGTSAVVEVTGLRNPCKQLDDYRPGLLAAVLDRDVDGNMIRKAGIMAIVICGGDVEPGADISVKLPVKPFRRLEPV